MTVRRILVTALAACALLGLSVAGPAWGQRGERGQQGQPGQGQRPGPGVPPPGAPPGGRVPLDVYATVPTAVGPVRDERSPNELAADRERRARVVARVGDVVVTVGEVEDHLSASSPAVVEAFRAGRDRHAVVERLLRGHLLALEAERRGVLDPAARFAAQRREERVLRDLLELEVRRDPGAIPPPAPPVDVAETRFAVVLRTGSREVAEAWARDNHDTSYTTALAHANEVGQGQETPFGARDAIPEASPPIEPAVWSALFSLSRIGETSRPISLGGGQFAVVLEAGLTEGYTDTGPDEAARRMLAGDRAWQELVAQVRADRVAELDVSVIDGVAFRSIAGRSPEENERLARQLADERERAARAEAAAAAEAEGSPEHAP